MFSGRRYVAVLGVSFLCGCFDYGGLLMSSDLIEFIRSARGPISIYYAAAELESLGSRGAGWQRATATHWVRELRALVDAGELVLDGDVLTVAKIETMKQGELF